MPQEIAVRPRSTSVAVVLSLEEAAGAAGDFARASKSAATRRAYQADAADFACWCKRQGLQPLPATVDTVAAYLAALAAAGLKASTITRRCAGIGYMHRIAGVEPPTTSEAIRAVLSGIRRTIGSSVTRKAPATAETVGVIIAAIPTDLRGLRDRALLLVGFAGALRRSELVALDVSDLEESAEGFHVRIRRSKTDQEGHRRLCVDPVWLSPPSHPSTQGLARSRWHRRGACVPTDPPRRQGYRARAAHGSERGEHREGSCRGCRARSRCLLWSQPARGLRHVGSAGWSRRASRDGRDTTPAGQYAAGL